ncbi:hypothetical protein [Streptomyces kaniharaensis]|nr:hypothetical protein [Streptomyces kaniharaensis]
MTIPTPLRAPPPPGNRLSGAETVINSASLHQVGAQAVTTW